MWILSRRSVLIITDKHLVGPLNVFAAQSLGGWPFALPPMSSGGE